MKTQIDNTELDSKDVQVLQIVQSQIKVSGDRIEGILKEISSSTRPFLIVCQTAEELGDLELRFVRLQELQDWLHSKQTSMSYKEILRDQIGESVRRLCGSSHSRSLSHVSNCGDRGPWKHDSTSYMNNLENQAKANAERYVYQLCHTLLGVFDS